jgi:prolipoprotein diacylglyceryltransferase
VHPVLLELGSFAVTSYGVALVLAFAVGIAERPPKWPFLRFLDTF